ncbi:hypothetical protein OH77DRAFT_969294 [Trametes cingulata]|nr:hypothetical protein OH77DRAFT_969294 [Trametes cingulata]
MRRISLVLNVLSLIFAQSVHVYRTSPEAPLTVIRRILKPAKPSYSLRNSEMRTFPSPQLRGNILDLCEQDNHNPHLALPAQSPGGQKLL